MLPSALPGLRRARFVVILLVLGFTRSKISGIVDWYTLAGFLVEWMTGCAFRCAREQKEAIICGNVFSFRSFIFVINR